jgi:hypothetical protein
MTTRNVLPAIFVFLATASLVAQTAPGSQPRKAAPARTAVKAAAPANPAKAAGGALPAVAQEHLITIRGCLQHDHDYMLTNVSASDEDKSASASLASSYRLEGLSDARLSLLVGQRVDVTGAPRATDSASVTAKTPAGAPWFEATAAHEIAAPGTGTAGARGAAGRGPAGARGAAAASGSAGANGAPAATASAGANGAGTNGAPSTTTVSCK